MFQEFENSLGNTLRGAPLSIKKVEISQLMVLEVGKFNIMVLVFG